MKYVATLQMNNDLLVNGIQCITSLKDLYINMWLEECTELVITRPFAETYFTYQGLVSFMRQYKSLFPGKKIEIEGMSYMDIDSSVKKLKTYETPEEFIFALNRDPEKVMQTIHELCKHYLSVNEDISIASNKIATLYIKLTSKENELETLQKRMSQVQEHTNDVESALHVLVSRMNYQYEKTVDEKSLFDVSENQYIKVLYIKEISRVHYTDTLLYYLSEIVKTLYSEPLRRVVIGPYYAYKQSELYPDFKPHWNLTYKDVFSSDIYMAGMQPKLLSDIAQNATHVHYLVVLDRSGCNAPFLHGSNVTTIYTASDVSDAIDIPKDRLVSYSESTLNIPYIEDFETISVEDRIQKYSTMPIMHKLLEMLEER